MISLFNVLHIFRTLSTDGTEQDQVLFNEAIGISCIDQSSCLDNEICVKHGDTDVGNCQCPLDFMRSIGGMYKILIFICTIWQNKYFRGLYASKNFTIRIFFNVTFTLFFRKIIDLRSVVLLMMYTCFYRYLCNDG